MDARIEQRSAPRTGHELVSSGTRVTWMFALIFLPIETYLSFWHGPVSISGYIVNVVGVAIMLWGAVSLRRGRAYAEGLLAAGWGWTTAIFWRGTNLRFMFAGDGEPLAFGSLELWLAPMFTIIVATGFIRSLVRLVNHASGERA
jgi:hypothetical protein